MTRNNGLCATNQPQQEYGTWASPSCTNTEPLALSTNSDLFTSASKPDEKAGLKKPKKPKT